MGRLRAPALARQQSCATRPAEHLLLAVLGACSGRTILKKTAALRGPLKGSCFFEDFFGLNRTKEQRAPRKMCTPLGGEISAIQIPHAKI